MPTKLGQNFLTDKTIVRKITQSANLSPEDFVLEVGPGKGILTEELVEKAGKVIAIEIDNKLIPEITNKFKDKKNLKIIQGDILKTNLSELILNNLSYKVIANIPYYITSKIIRLFLESENPPAEIILMVQKEVAERIVARPGKMSLLGVSVQYYADVKIIFEVGRNCFFPVPEVDSAVIRITPHTPSLLQGEGGRRPDEVKKTKKFFQVAKAGFSSKRKTLLNNLSSSFHLEKEEALKKLTQAGFNQNTRAQELSIENWEKLAKVF